MKRTSIGLPMAVMTTLLLGITPAWSQEVEWSLNVTPASLASGNAIEPAEITDGYGAGVFPPPVAFPCDTCSPAPAGPSAGCPVWYAEADVLLWRVSRPGLDVGIYDLDVDDIMGPAQIVRVDPDYGTGFRLAAGRRGITGWDIGVRWTSFDASDRASFEDPEEYSWGTRIHPDRSANGGDGDIGYAVSDYTIDLDLVDFEIGYRMDYSVASFRPFGGLRLSSIDQGMATSYTDFDDRFDDYFTRILERTKTNAVGLYLGSDAAVPLAGGRLQLIGRVAVGVHIADVSSSLREMDFYSTGDFDEDNLRVSGTEGRGIGSVETYAGALLHVWQGSKCNFDVAAGYELQMYHNMADFISFNDDSFDASMNRNNSADLLFDGVFLRLVGTY